MEFSFSTNALTIAIAIIVVSELRLHLTLAVVVVHISESDRQTRSPIRSFPGDRGDHDHDNNLDVGVEEDGEDVHLLPLRRPRG